jgi:hypothetical protein
MFGFGKKDDDAVYEIVDPARADENQHPVAEPKGYEGSSGRIIAEALTEIRNEQRNDPDSDLYVRKRR